MMAFLRIGFLVVLTVGWGAPFRVSAAEIFGENTPWQYRKGTTEASSPSTAWRAITFNDAGWQTGNAPFFYDTGTGYSGNTTLADMPNSYSCIFMRKTFPIANPAGVQDLTLEVRSDDGCIVWINGTRVLSLGMPAAEPVFNDFAPDANGEPKSSSVPVPNPGALLVAGNNVIAIQAFNQSHSSSDFLIAASLSTTVDTLAPVVDDIFPAPGATVRQLTQIEVLFNEAVTNVSASDLWINGTPATSVVVYSPVNYIFSFPEPPPGLVQVAWTAGHGITDRSPAANPFPGGSWSYVLDPTAEESTVIISEILARNNNGLRDNYGMREDWIEILNLGPLPVNLGGWFLTDDDGYLTKWRFPSTNVNVGQALIVWASGRGDPIPGIPLHANFNLSGGGEYLALVNSRTNVVSAFAPAFPPQSDDVSYGRDRADPNVLGFFDLPTPGAPNANSGSGFAPEPIFSVTGGAYSSNTLSLRLSVAPGTVAHPYVVTNVHYTLDGSTPTAASPRYLTPLNLTSSSQVRARTFVTGTNWFPSRVAVQTYNLLGTSAQNFPRSNLPLLIVNTFGRGITENVPPGGARTPATIVVIDTFRGRAGLADPPQFQGACAIEVRGQTSAGFAKRPYNVELQDGNGSDLEVGLLGLPAESDWVLLNPYSDKTFMNNRLAFELHRQMGHYAIRQRYVEVFLDTSGGRLEYNQDYVGIYVLQERIKVDGNRVDIARLTPEQNGEPNISGGYIFKKDKDSTGDVNFGTVGGAGFSAQGLKFHDPKPREITSAQQNWLRNYLIRFEQAMYAGDWITRAGTNHYSHYIDVDSFVDNHWMVEFSKQIDGYRLSSYFHKDRGGKVNWSPIWDWNLSFGNADYLEGARTNGWYYPLIGENEHIWLRRLIAGNTSGTGTAGDPDFHQKVADRWSELRTTVFAPTNVLALVNEWAAYLNEAQARDFTKFNRLNSELWPNPNAGEGDVNYASPGTYANLINEMRRWITGRFGWIDSQFHPAPSLGSPGGLVPPGFVLSLSAPAGTIYYTTDGRDPRAPGGSVAAYARTYTGPITITANARVVARVRAATGKWVNHLWSGPAAGTFVTAVPPLVITEIMYHPAAPPAGNTNDPGNYEFIELQNAGTNALNLAGFQFINGLQFNFSTGAVASLNPGARVLLVKNAVAFASRYGIVPNVAGQYTGGLRDSGERLTLVGPMLETVQDLSFKDGWYPATDGMGFALVTTTNGTAIAGAGPIEDRLVWRAGSVLGGTPGQEEPPAPALAPILVNEVLTHTDWPTVDAIELYNPNPTNVNIGGWRLSDDFRQPKYQIPAGTVIPALGYRVFTELEFNGTPDTNRNFTLRSAGDEVYLFSGDATGNLTGYMHGYSFGASLNNVAFGRHVISTGDEQFVAQQYMTFGQRNPGPRVGPIVISEIMYHPQDVLANGAYWNNTEDEFVELYNLTATNVPLYDPTAPTNTWRLRDAVDYAFPMGQQMAAGERLLVVGFDPAADPVAAAAFRTRLGLNPGVRLFGPFEGQLANADDSVELVQPDVVRFYTTNIVITAVLKDQVQYQDVYPWPLAADGGGFSLQRITPAAYGNDPTNWLAAAPTPGAAYVPGAAPVIQAQPQSQSVLAGNTVVLSVAVSGGGPFQYQWRHNGNILPGAVSAFLTLSNVQAEQAGQYQVLVLNAANSVSSELATLTVLVPARVTSHPQSVEVTPGQSAVFTVAATSSSPLAYQWRRNGWPIAGATNAQLAFAAAQPADDAYYDVLVTDAIGSVKSGRARLMVLVDPKYVVLPVSQTNVVGSTVILSVQVTNTATLPVTYRWRFNNRTITNNTWRDGYRILNSRTAFLVLSNVQLADAGNYDVIVTNQAYNTPGYLSSRYPPDAPSTAWVKSDVAVLNQPVPDTDGDGLPDAYENAHGLNPGNPADADADADGDTLSNREEHIAGTDPRNPQSFLKLENVVATGAVAVRFNAVANRTYTLLYRDSLLTGEWTVIEAVPAVSATATSLRLVEVLDRNPSPAGPRYYRLVTPALLTD